MAKIQKVGQRSKDRPGVADGKEQAAMELATAITPAEMQTDRRAKGQPEDSKKKQLASPNMKLTTGLADLGGSMVAQGLNEGWSYLMRVAGRASVDGFVANQNDYLQASVPALGGLVWYLLELYGLSNSKAPSGFKLGRMEAAKLVSNLGMAKFFQALRSRGADAKAELEKAQASAKQAVANSSELRRKLDTLEQQIKEEAAKQEEAERQAAKNKSSKG